MGLDANKKNLVKIAPDDEKLIGYSEMSEIMNINLLGYLQAIGYAVTIFKEKKLRNDVLNNQRGVNVNIFPVDN